MTKVLVTGGDGFLGTSVVAGLAAAGMDVTSADLRHRSPSAKGVTQVVLDVTDAGRVAEVVAGHDVVVHLASIVDPGGEVSREHAYRVDVDGSRHVVDACVAHGVRRLVVSSSGAAYGYHADSSVPLTERDPVRGNEEFAYSHHKALVERLLADARTAHPGLEQVVLRIGTILGERVDNQITALFYRPRLLMVRGADSPFVFIWDEDLVQVVVRAATDAPPGVYNVAGTGTLTVPEIAARLGKRTLAVPEVLLKAALLVGRRLGVSRYGPEQTGFLRYRPVLDNRALREVLGYTPARTSEEAFEAWLATHPDARAR